MATHSSIVAWNIPWTEEPGGLQFVGSQSWTHKHINTNYRPSIKLCVGKIKKKKKRMVQALRKNTIFIIRNTSGINGL